MRLINKLLKPFGVILLPRTSAKMLTESSNIVESYWSQSRPSSDQIVAEFFGDKTRTRSVEALVEEVAGGAQRPSRTVLWLRHAADQLHPGGDEYK